MDARNTQRVALIEAGSPGLNIYSHVAMGRGVPLLATVLREEGFDAHAYVEDISGKGSVDWEFVSGADVVGFSSITCTLTRTAELVAETRQRNPEATIVFGGPEPTCAPERSFEAGADYVIRGEAEHTLPEFLRALERGGHHGEAPCPEVTRVRGVVWREGERLGFGPPPQQLTSEEISSLPLIDMSLVRGAEGRTTGLVWRSRGCPERCSFCEVHQIWPHYVLRDEEKSAEELLRCQSETTGGAFLIDDNCAANKPSFKRFMRNVIERGYARPLALQLRADAVFDKNGRLDRELLRLLRDLAPTTMVCVGVESANDSDLDQVGKHETSRQMARALKAIKRQGLLVHGMFIAFANDTAETLKRNGRFARKYVTSLQYLFEVPLPGTESTAEHEAAGRVLVHGIPELKFLDGMHVALQPQLMSAKKMQETVVAEYKRYYSRLRTVRAFLAGLFLRNRRLGEGPRAYLRTLRPWRRVKEWIWLHLEFKFAPWMMLRIGRERVLEFMRDSEYTDYLCRLDG
jgi:anaerobic magnesium-protoporphyrin IX monomethyl ester cyclase